VPFSTSPVLELQHAIGSNTFSGPFTVQPEDVLSSANSKVVLQGVIHGPEHLIYKPSTLDSTLDGEAKLPGTLLTASVNGTIYSMTVSETGEILPGTVQEIIYVGPGRVLGIAVDSVGGLYMCNTVQVSLYALHCLLQPDTHLCPTSSAYMLHLPIGPQHAPMQCE
jgi:hypothetical protein